MPLTLPPAQKAVPAPVIKSAPMSGFSPQVRIMVRKAGVRLSDIAFFASGRLSVMIATPSRIMQSNSLVPVSMLVSAVINASLFVIARSQRIRAKRGPMTGSATRQSSLCGALDCFAAPAMTVCSEFLHPWPQFQLPGPGTTRLLQYIPIAQRNRIGIKKRIRPVGRIRAGGAADTTIDHKVADVNALRGHFAREALRKPAERKLAHRERCRLWIALDAGRGAGEQDRAMLIGQHALERLLRHQEAAEGAGHDRLRDVGRRELDKSAARPRAGVIDDDVGCTDLALDHAEQAFDLIRVGGIAGKGSGTSLTAKRAELFNFSCGKRNRDLFAGEQPRQRRAQALANADNEGGPVFWRFHGWVS